MLQVAVVHKTHKDLINDLPNGIEFVRKGNHLQYYVKHLRKDTDSFFQESGCGKMGCITFLPFCCLLELIGRIRSKKKKLDVIVCKSVFIRKIFELMGYRCAAMFDEDLMKSLKFKDGSIEKSEN